MKCCYCGALLGEGDHCPSCGKNIYICRQTQQISNLLYNDALELAHQRRLSDAAVELELSLRYYKSNTRARNLLGLIDYELGEFYASLSQWNISLSLDRVDNPARDYLDRFQGSAQQIELLEQTARKFNQALSYCEQKNYDLAEIQLKNILENFPHYVQALHLQALLEMREGRYDRAMDHLVQANRTDRSNEDIGRLMAECRSHLTRDGKVKERDLPKEKKKRKNPYRAFSERAVIGPLMNLVFGLIIGAAVMGFLVIPAVRSNTSASVSNTLRETSETVTAKNQQIKSLQSQIGDLQQQLKEEKNAAKSAQSASDDAASAYSILLQAYDAFSDKEYDNAEQLLDSVDKDQLSEDALKIYRKLKKEIKSRQETASSGNRDGQASGTGNSDDSQAGATTQ